jgi:cell division protein FtsB
LANHSKSQTRRQSRITWRLLGGVLGITLGLFLYVRWLSLPWSLGAQTNREVRVLESQLRERHAENARLTRHLAYLKSPEGIEALARSRGYHHADETVYLEPHSAQKDQL